MGSCDAELAASSAVKELDDFLINTVDCPDMALHAVVSDQGGVDKCLVHLQPVLRVGGIDERPRLMFWAELDTHFSGFKFTQLIHLLVAP